MGVTGGTPLGFDVGAKGAGGTLAGLDLVRPSTRMFFPVQQPAIEHCSICVLDCTSQMVCI